MRNHRAVFQDLATLQHLDFVELFLLVRHDVTDLGYLHYLFKQVSRQSFIGRLQVAVRLDCLGHGDFLGQVMEAEHHALVLFEVNLSPFESQLLRRILTILFVFCVVSAR